MMQMPDADPPVVAQLRRGDDAQAHEPEDEDRQLEQDPAGQDRDDRERVVLLRAHLRVVEVGVVVEQERDGGRKHDPVGEGHPDREQHGRDDHEVDDCALGALLEGRREERPELPDEDRDRERDRGVERDVERRRERLRRAERQRLRPFGQRLREPADDRVPEGVREDEEDRDRAQRDDQPGAELLEVLDERRFLTVAEAPRQPGHRATRRSRRAGRVVTGGSSSVAARKLVRLVVLAGDRVLELAHALAERAPHLRQPLRPEDHEEDDEDDDRALPADVSGHAPRVAPAGGRERVSYDGTKRSENPLQERVSDRTKWHCWN